MKKILSLTLSMILFMSLVGGSVYGFSRISIEEPGDLEMPIVKPNDGVEVIVTPIGDEVNRVILDWGEQPNPGYGISVQRIEFDHSEKKARIIYQLHYPDPDLMYPQVIVHAKTETFVAAGYEIEALRAIDKGAVISDPKPIKPAPINPPKLIK